jgi:hypothetical protein
LDGDGVTDVAVIDTGVANHPALSAHKHAASERNFINQFNPTTDTDGHGTAIAGIIVSTDANYKGIGFGLDKIVNAKIGTGDTALFEQRLKDAVEWAVTNTTNGKETAEIVNISYAVSGQSGDYPSIAQYFDGVINSYLVTVTFAVGNTALSMEYAPRAYNGLSVGNMDNNNNSNRSDDTLSTSSARGPTQSGRNKPDIVAPGTNITTTRWNSNVTPFITKTGTSYAAPHVAGAAGLIMNYEGYGDPRQIKALLLNSAETKGTPDSVGWSPGYGYGYVDLTKAYNQKSAGILINLLPSQSRWFSGQMHPNEKVTITWHRRVINPPNTTAYNLSDIDLVLYTLNDDDDDGNIDPEDLIVIDASNEVIENVEQVQYSESASSTVYVQVHAYSSSFHGATPDEPHETVAVAFPNDTFTTVSMAPLRPIVDSGQQANQIANELGQNFPNVFNPETWIPYSIRQASDVTIRIYDPHGELVRTLSLGEKQAGKYFTKGKAAHWDGRNEIGERVTSGIYFYHIQAGTFSATRKMVMTK